MKRLLLILSFFLALSVLGGGLFLKQGIYIEHLATSSVTLHNISLQWHKKLELQIEQVVIAVEQRAAEKHAPDFSSVEKIIPLVQWIERLFAKIEIQNITVGEMTADFLYTSSVGQFNLSSPYLTLRTTLTLEAGVLAIEIEELSSEQFGSQATGEVHFDLERKSGEGQLSAILADSLPVNLTFLADQHQFSFQGKEGGLVTTITPFVDLFGLSQNIQRWITEYLTGSRYKLKTFSGDFPWENPLHLLESFYGEVRVEDCQYTFAPGLEPIKASYTDVSFEKGVLDIVPHDSTFYGQDTEDSWLDINFNDIDNILLTAYIVTSAVGNADIMNLLEYYKIPLPFVQIEGKTKTDLILAISLNDGEIIATGNFQIDEGVILYDNVPCSVKDAELVLKNSRISIKNMDLTYGETLHVELSGFFDAADKKGDIDIILRSLVIPMGEPDALLELDTSTVQPKLQYQIRPEGVRIEGEESFWRLNTISMQLGSFSTPFVLDDYSGVLPPTQIVVKKTSNGEMVRAELAGTFSGKKKEVDLHGALQELHLGALTLESKNAPIRIYYKDGLFIEQTKASQWVLGEVPLTLYSTTGAYRNNIFSVASDKLIYGDIFESGIDGSYNTALQKGEYSITEPSFGTGILSKLLSSDPVTVQLDGSGDYLQLAVPELDLTVSSSGNKQWSAHIGDLKTAYKRSPLLQQFKVDAGEITVNSVAGDTSYRFTADIPWKYPLLVADNKPMEQYRITGTVNAGSVQAEINDQLHISYTEKIEVHSKGVFYNIPAISKFYKECIQPYDDGKEKKNSARVTLTATDSGFYLSPVSKVIAGKMELNSEKNKVTIELVSGLGRVSVNMEGEQFSIHGKDLNDVFMNALSPDADLYNGTMDVTAKGEFDDFSVLIEVKKTVLKDFKTMNNVLALVNTIPALITFSLPSYSSNGLYVSSAVMGAKFVDGVATIKSIDITSSELSIAGKGWIDFLKKTIGMDLNLITQSKKNMQKIPLLGYILAGAEKHPSITVRVSGDLANPVVEHKTFKEVATIPFGILYRTLALPAHLVSPLIENNDELQQEDPLLEEINGK